MRPLTSEASLWQILPYPPPESASGQAKGLLGIYVDDLLISSEEGMITALIAAIETLWEVSKPQYASSVRLHFLGVDIHYVAGYYFIGQQDYISSLLDKHKEVEGQSPVPYPTDKDPEEPEELSLANVRLAQAWVGEMTWLSTKTRGDLAWPVNRAAQLVSKNPLRSIEACQTMLRYLRGTQSLCLVYGPQDGEPCQVATYSDASFAPSGERSQSGVCLLWANALLAWGSSRQSFLTMSTCEAELYAAVEAYILSQSLKDLLEELTGPVEVTLFGDNVAAVSVIVLPSGSWRTRHLRLRARFIHEQLELGVLKVKHMPGENLVADLFTKPLAPARMQKLLALMNMKVFDERALRALLVMSLLNSVSAQPTERVQLPTNYWIVYAFLIGVIFGWVLGHFSLLQRVALWLVRRFFVGSAFVSESAELALSTSESSASEDRATEAPRPAVSVEGPTYEDLAEMSEGVCVCRYADDLLIVAPREAFEVAEGLEFRPHEEAARSSDQGIGERRVEYSDRFLFEFLNSSDDLSGPFLEASPSRRTDLEEPDEFSVGTLFRSSRSAADDLCVRNQGILTSTAASSSAVQKPKIPVPKAPPRFDHSQWVASNPLPKPKGGGCWTPPPKAVPARESVVHLMSQSIPKKNPPPKASPKSGDRA